MLLLFFDLNTEDPSIGTHAKDECLCWRIEIWPQYGTWVVTCVTVKSGLTGKDIIAGGLPAAAIEPSVGKGAPVPPTNLSFTNFDPTTVLLTKPSVVNITGYVVYVRNVKHKPAFHQDSITTNISQRVRFSFPIPKTLIFLCPLTVVISKLPILPVL
jgi:hypothetical protein